MISLASMNWPAISIGTVVYCAFCGMWHRQGVFGRKWEAAMGFTRPANWKETKIYYVVPLISCFITTAVIAILLGLTGTKSFIDAIILGLLIGAGIAMAIVFTTAVIPVIKKPLVFGAITGTAQAIGVTIVTLIVYALSK